MSSGIRVIDSLLFLILVLSGTSVATASDVLTISVSRSPLCLPIYVAENEGFFSAEGVQIKFSEVLGGHRAMSQLLSGETDLATASDAVIMFNSFKRDDFAVIGTFVTSNDDVKVVTRKNSGIAKPDQLAGKRIGTVVGSSSDYFLDTLLLFHGVDPKSLHVINLQPENMEAALSKGEVDAVAIWEPYPFKILNSIEGTKTLTFTPTYIETFNLIARKNLFGMRDDDLVKILRALDRAQRFIRDEPVKAQAILRSRLQLDQTFVDWMWTRFDYRMTLDQSLLSTLESEARWARSEGMVIETHSPNYLSFIFSDPLRKVRPEAVGIAK